MGENFTNRRYQGPHKMGIWMLLFLKNPKSVCIWREKLTYNLRLPRNARNRLQQINCQRAQSWKSPILKTQMLAALDGRLFVYVRGVQWIIFEWSPLLEIRSRKPTRQEKHPLFQTLIIHSNILRMYWAWEVFCWKRSIFSWSSNIIIISINNIFQIITKI